jgi:hypothetical protein
MRNDDQVETLLTTWMAPHRNDVEVDDELVPFDRSALSVLRQLSQGRPGDLLHKANEVFDAAAQTQVGTIDGEFVRDHLQGAATRTAVGTDETDSDYAAEVEDLLA